MPWIPAVGAAIGAIGGLASAGTSIGMTVDQISKQNAAVERNKQRQAQRENMMKQMPKVPSAIGATGASPLGEPAPTVQNPGLGPPGWLTDVRKKNDGGGTGGY